MVLAAPAEGNRKLIKYDKSDNDTSRLVYNESLLPIISITQIDYVKTMFIDRSPYSYSTACIQIEGYPS